MKKLFFLVLIISLMKISICKAATSNPEEINDYDLVRHYYYNSYYENPYSYYYDYKKGGFIDYENKYKDNHIYKNNLDNHKKHKDNFYDNYYKDYYNNYYDFNYYDYYYDYLQHNYYMD